MVRSAWVKGAGALVFEGEGIARGELVIDGGEVLILRAERHVTQAVLQSFARQYAEAVRADQKRRIAEVVPLKRRRRRNH